SHCGAVPGTPLPLRYTVKSSLACRPPMIGPRVSRLPVTSLVSTFCGSNEARGFSTRTPSVAADGATKTPGVASAFYQHRGIAGTKYGHVRLLVNRCVLRSGKFGPADENGYAYDHPELEIGSLSTCRSAFHWNRPAPPPGMVPKSPSATTGSCR